MQGNKSYSLKTSITGTGGSDEHHQFEFPDNGALADALDSWTGLFKHSTTVLRSMTADAIQAAMAASAKPKKHDVTVSAKFSGPGVKNTEISWKIDDCPDEVLAALKTGTSEANASPACSAHKVG